MKLSTLKQIIAVYHGSATHDPGNEANGPVAPERKKERLRRVIPIRFFQASSSIQDFERLIQEMESESVKDSDQVPDKYIPPLQKIESDRAFRASGSPTDLACKRISVLWEANRPKGKIVDHTQSIHLVRAIFFSLFFDGMNFYPSLYCLVFLFLAQSASDRSNHNSTRKDLDLKYSTFDFAAHRNENYEKILATQAQKLKISPPPKLVYTNLFHQNTAFAYPYSLSCAPTGFIAMGPSTHDPEEVTGLLAHELGHIKDLLRPNTKILRNVTLQFAPILIAVLIGDLLELPLPKSNVLWLLTMPLRKIIVALVARAAFLHFQKKSESIADGFARQLTGELTYSSFICSQSQWRGEDTALHIKGYDTANGGLIFCDGDDRFSSALSLLGSTDIHPDPGESAAIPSL